MSCNVLLLGVLVKLVPLTILTRPAAAVLAPLQKQLLGIGNAPWMSSNEVDVLMSSGKRVPLGSLQKKKSTP
jgi:hypothetical protein